MSDGTTDLYPNLRRVITGHDADGKSVVMIDDLCRYSGAGTDGFRFQDIWSHRVLPIQIDATEDDPTGKPFHPGVIENGIFVRVSDVPPFKPGDTPYMHRTNSVDYLHVLEGEITMLLSEGVEPVILRTGDTIQQRATEHAWVNHTDRHCRLLIVMIAGRATEALERLIGKVPLWDPAGRAKAEEK